MESNEALAELDFKITEVDLSGAAGGDPPQTPIKSIEVKLKSNEAVVEFDFNFNKMDLTEVARGEPASTQISFTKVALN